MVHSNYKGQGIMKQMVNFLIEKANNDGLEWLFSKVNKSNFASSKSLQKNGFDTYCDYIKPVNKNEFISLSSQDFFSKTGKENAKVTLDNFKDAEEITVYYDILLKRL